MISIASPLSLVVAWSPIVIGLQRCFSCIGCARSIGILLYLGRGVAKGEKRLAIERARRDPFDPTEYPDEGESVRDEGSAKVTSTILGAIGVSRYVPC